MTKLGVAMINGKAVSFFEPPHKDGPDFPKDRGEEFPTGILCHLVTPGRFAADHWPLSFEGIIHAFHHSGGHFMQALRDE